MSRKSSKNKSIETLVILAFIFIASISSYIGKNFITSSKATNSNISSFNMENIPQYEKEPFVYINDNKPFFSEDDYTTQAFENYSELDSLGRCGVAYANICKELMPTEKRRRNRYD